MVPRTMAFFGVSPCLYPDGILRVALPVIEGFLRCKWVERMIGTVVFGCFCLLSFFARQVVRGQKLAVITWHGLFHNTPALLSSSQWRLIKQIDLNRWLGIRVETCQLLSLTVCMHTDAIGAEIFFALSYDECKSSVF